MLVLTLFAQACLSQYLDKYSMKSLTCTIIYNAIWPMWYKLYLYLFIINFVLL